MIISDERWATATMVVGPRGVEPRLFDDFNCQVRFEANSSELIQARWSHCFSTRDWIRTESAQFLISPDLRSPMGSSAAAFASLEAADDARMAMAGEVMSFGDAWSHLIAE